MHWRLTAFKSPTLRNLPRPSRYMYVLSMKQSLCITSGDEDDLSSSSPDTRHHLQHNDFSANKASPGIFSAVLAVSLALIIGAVATVGYYNHFSSNTRSDAFVEERSLQQFGDDGDSPFIATIVMTEESVSDVDVHEMLYGDNDAGSDEREDIIPMANEAPTIEVDSVVVNETENGVMVDQAATSRRRNAILVKQALVQSGEKLKILYMNTIDVQPGDFVALVSTRVDTSAGLSNDDYIAYAYVCAKGSDPIFDCPKYGTVVWDVGTNVPSGRYKAVLSKEDGPEPYTIKAETSGPFMIQGANRVEVVEGPTPAPPSVSPPIENPNQSLDTVMNGGIRNNGIIFEVEAKQTIRITSIDIHTPLTEVIPITVYAMSGSAVGKERDSSQWSKLASGKVHGNGDGQRTSVPVSLVIQAGRRIAFYCDTPSVFIPGPIRYSPSQIPTGGIFSEDDSIRIIVGYGLDPFFGESYPNRIFNGGVNYEKL